MAAWQTAQGFGPPSILHPGGKLQLPAGLAAAAVAEPEVLAPSVQPTCFPEASKAETSARCSQQWAREEQSSGSRLAPSRLRADKLYSSGAALRKCGPTRALSPPGAESRQLRQG